MGKGALERLPVRPMHLHICRFRPRSCQIFTSGGDAALALASARLVRVPAARGIARIATVGRQDRVAADSGRPALGYGEADVPSLAERAFAQQRPLVMAPRSASGQDLESIYRGALGYW
jgi:hypothetical protein